MFLNHKIEIESVPEGTILHLSFEKEEQAKEFYKNLGVNNGDSDRCLATLYNIEDSYTVDQKPVVFVDWTEIPNTIPFTLTDATNGKIIRGSRVIPHGLSKRFSDM